MLTACFVMSVYLLIVYGKILRQKKSGWCDWHNQVLIPYQHPPYAARLVVTSAWFLHFLIVTVGFECSTLLRLYTYIVIGDHNSNGCWTFDFLTAKLTLVLTSAHLMLKCHMWNCRMLIADMIVDIWKGSCIKHWTQPVMVSIPHWGVCLFIIFMHNREHKL